MAILLCWKYCAMNNPIHENALVEISGQTLFIKSMQVDLKDIVLRGKGGIERVLDFQEFYNGLSSGDIKIPGYSPERTQKNWEPSEYAEAIFRKDIVKLCDKDKYKSASKAEQSKLLVELSEEHIKKAPSLKTIRSYQKKYSNGGFEALIPKYSARGGSGWSKKFKHKELAERIILETFAVDDKLNIASTARLVNLALVDEKDAEGAPVSISAHTVSRIINEMPRDMVLEGRLDPRTFRLQSRQAVNEFYVEYAFELVQVDAKTIDMYVVDAFGKRYSQITLYSMICSRTGYPVGIYVTGGAPSEYTLLKLFEFFFAPKDAAFKEKFELESDWPAPCGLNKVLLDNASENAGGVSLEIVRDLGIDIHYARAYRGDDKPYVESFFNVLEKKVFKRMPGAKNSSDSAVKNRHDRAEKEACYTVEDVYKDIVQFVADHYVNLPKVKLGFRYGESTSIKQSLDEELKRFMPPPPPSLEKVQRLILQKNKTTRVVQHYGIDFECFQYHSYEFASLAKKHTLSDVEILFNPSECAYIFAVNPFNNELIKLDCKMRGVPNVSFELIKSIRKEYEGDPNNMNDHEYNRVYGRLLAKWAKDSQRRSKVSDNNRAGRKSAQKRHHDEVKVQLESCAAPARKPVVQSDDIDDDFIPAPRESLSHEPNR